MAVVYVLYTPDDPFSRRRTEMLVGSMVLAGVRYGRFTAQDIDPATLKIRAQIWETSHWKRADDLLPDAILDLSRPSSPRTAAETALLSTVPHSSRIDLNLYELLNLLAQDSEFRNHIAPIRPLTDFADLQEGLAQWGPVILKSCTEQGRMPSLVIIPEAANWRVHETHSNRLMNDSALHALIQARLGDQLFIQRFVPSRNPLGRQTILHLTLQQRGDGCWMTPDIRGVLATDALFASLDAGGEFEGMPFKMGDFCPPVSDPQTDLPKLNSIVQRLGAAAARRVEELLPGPCATLGFSVGFDLQSRPWIVSATPRPVAPRRPGKNMEFFRHLSQFALGLATPRTPYQHTAPSLTPTQLPQPTAGTTIIGQILPEQIDRLISDQPPWLDIGVGNGGRTLLAAVGTQAGEPGGRATSWSPLLSLRLGVATSDIIADPKPERPSIKATENYIGGGLLRLGETTLMRSARVPLLQAQLHQGQQELNGIPPSLLWLEDPDLGLRPLTPEQRSLELQNTVTWFEHLCAHGQSGAWGVILFNPAHPASLGLLRELREMAGSDSRLTHVGVRGTSFPAALSRILAKYQLHPVLVVRNATLNGSRMTQLRAEGVSLLQQWQANPSASTAHAGES